MNIFVIYVFLFFCSVNFAFVSIKCVFFLPNLKPPYCSCLFLGHSSVPSDFRFILHTVAFGIPCITNKQEKIICFALRLYFSSHSRLSIIQQCEIRFVTLPSGQTVCVIPTVCAIRLFSNRLEMFDPCLLFM